jgi:excisionase family DNA binding protein
MVLSTVSDKLLLNAREAAALLSISTRKLWALTASGEIPKVPVGRAVRYSIDDLREWIERVKVSGN